MNLSSLTEFTLHVSLVLLLLGKKKRILTEPDKESSGLQSLLWQLNRELDVYCWEDNFLFKHILNSIESN